MKTEQNVELAGILKSGQTLVAHVKTTSISLGAVQSQTSLKVTTADKTF